MGGDKPLPVKPTIDMSQDMLRTALCYAERGPLLAYWNVAVIDATHHTSDSSF